MKKKKTEKIWREPGKIKNPQLSSQQKAFEAWACTKPGFSLDRNFYVPYHTAPYTYEELFKGIGKTDYYKSDRTQAAWDTWRHLTSLKKK